MILLAVRGEEGVFYVLVQLLTFRFDVSDICSIIHTSLINRFARFWVLFPMDPKHRVSGIGYPHTFTSDKFPLC